MRLSTSKAADREETQPISRHRRERYSGNGSTAWARVVEESGQTVAKRESDGAPSEHVAQVVTVAHDAKKAVGSRKGQVARTSERVREPAAVERQMRVVRAGEPGSGERLVDMTAGKGRRRARSTLVVGGSVLAIHIRRTSPTDRIVQADRDERAQRERLGVHERELHRDVRIAANQRHRRGIEAHRKYDQAHVDRIGEKAHGLQPAGRAQAQRAAHVVVEEDAPESNADFVAVGPGSIRRSRRDPEARSARTQSDESEATPDSKQAARLRTPRALFAPAPASAIKAIP